MRFAFGLGLLLISCASPPEGPANAPNAQNAAAPGRAAQVVNATILTNGCQSLGATNAKLAEKAMYQLVEGCSSVPGGVAQFEATLQPGGRIDIAVASGQPDVVPTCILKHSLQHHVPLAKPCPLEVRIEQTSVTMPGDAGPG
jgi:hypothetical protein